MFDDIRDQFFPFQLNEDIIMESHADPATFWPHAGALMNAIFPPYASLGAYGYAVPEARRTHARPLARLFDQAHHEYFLFKTADDTYVGYSYGDMRDAQTFFMTSSGVLPAYRRRGLYTSFLRQLLRYLYALGYERVVSNHHPNNRAVIIAKLKAGFTVTAVNLDERWGAQVELTYLFHNDRRAIFCRAFALEERNTPRSHV